MSAKRPANLAGLTIDPEKLALLDPAERELVAEDLRVLEEAYKRNPLLAFHPHGKQIEFLSPETDGWWPAVRAFFGGNRSGKTTAVILYVLIQIVPAHLLPEHLRRFKRWDGPLRIRVITPDLTGTMDGPIHDKIRDWCPPEILKGNGFDRAFDKVLRVLRFKDGTTIQFNSSEQDREKLGGVPLHIVVYDEEPRQETRNECLARLIDYDGEELFALTPFSGMRWLFDELYEPWERGILDPREARVVVVDMDDNPHISVAGKERALAKYSGPERQARKSGMFVSFAGLIYPQFKQHQDEFVIPQLDRVPPGVELFRAIDPGYRHLCAVLYMLLDSDDELVVFDEIGLKAATVKEVCDEMSARDLRWGEQRGPNVFPLRSNWNVIDPASKNKNNQTGRSDQQEFWDNGVATIPGQNAVGAGINRVKERLDARKLKVTANCEGLIGEFRRYRWVQDTGRGENEAREAPVKKDDHRLDALRYAVMQRPLAPKEPIAPETMTGAQRMLRNHLKRLRKPQQAHSGFGPGMHV